MNILIELDSVRKDSNKSEYRNVNRAVCREFGLEVIGDGPIIKKLLKDLDEHNCDISRGVEIRRSGVLCFNVVPLNLWINPPDRRPEWLKEALTK